MDFDYLNSRLIEDMRSKLAGIDDRYYTAFKTVRRHIFIGEVDPEIAFMDEAIVTARDASPEGVAVSSSSQPSLMARMLANLDLRSGHRVLEIGTGTGYNAALLAELVGRAYVTSIDIDPSVVGRAKMSLAEAGYPDVAVLCMDGWTNLDPKTKYDRIIVTVGVGCVCPLWFASLNEGGMIAVPLNFQGVERVVTFRRVDNTLISVSSVQGGFIRIRGAGEKASLYDTIEPHILRDLVRPPVIQIANFDIYDSAAFGEYLSMVLPGTVVMSDSRLSPVGLVRVVADISLQQLVSLGSGSCFGGDQLGARLLVCYEKWKELGRPTAADIKIVISPSLLAEPIANHESEIVSRIAKEDEVYSFVVRRK